MEDIDINIDTFKDYLEKLNQLNSYGAYLNRLNKKDNLTNIKNFFNTHIFISIKDFDEEKYDKLFYTNKNLSKYIRQNPDRKAYKKIIKKKKKYKIFLRKI
mgnify:CR=1 FL=1